MKTEKLLQLEQEEQELLQRLGEIRREKAKLKEAERPKPAVTDGKEYAPVELEAMSKKQLLAVCEGLGIEPLSGAKKGDIAQSILRHYRAGARGRAFKALL